MCFFDPASCDKAGGVSRRHFLTAGVAAGVATAVADWSTSFLLSGLAEGAETPSGSGGPGSSGVSLKWLGTDAWEIAFANTTILLDPWLSRFYTGIFDGKFDPTTPIKVNQPLIDQHITRADQILIGHGHWDHMADVPYIARKTGAMVIGSESHANVLRASGVPDGQIVQVKGGEAMQFDGYTIEVFPGLHSMGPNKKYAFPGHLLSPPAPPATIRDMPEGDSLIYLLTIAGRFRIFLMSTANFVERAITGLRPDVALVGSIFANQTHGYVPRLLGALNRPQTILPTHWDNFERPYSEPPQDARAAFGDAGNLDRVVGEIKRVSPASKVVVLKYFESFAP